MSDYKERIDAVLSKVGNKDNNYDYTSAYKDRIDVVLKRIEDEPSAKVSNEDDGYMHIINVTRAMANQLKKDAKPKEDDIPHLSEDTHMVRDTQRRMWRVAPDDERGKELRNKVDAWNAEAVPQAIERLSIGEARVNPHIRPESPRVQRDYDVQNGRGERMATEITREQKARETSLENLYDYSSAQAKEITRKYANDTNPDMPESERSELERYLTKQIYTTAFENNIDESGRYWATAYELSTGKNYKEFEKEETAKARDRQKEIAKELEAILAELEQKKEENHNNAGQSRGFFSSVENDYKTPYGTEYEIAEDALDHVNDLLTGTFGSGLKAEYNFTNMASFGRGRTYVNEALNEYNEYVIKIKQLEAEADMLQDFRSQHGDVVHDKWLWGHVNANELGKGMGTTLEKAPEFAAAMYGTRGLGSFQTLSAKAALKAGQKDLIQYGINTIGKNYALAKARGFAAAPFMPSTYAEYLKSLNSGYYFDENGGIHYKAVDKTQAYLGAVISNANEISSEYIGVGFSEALGWGARSVGNMVANSKVGGAIVNGVRKVTPKLTPQAKTAMLTFGVQADPVAETLGEAWGDIMTTFEGGLIGKEVNLGEYFTMDYWTTLSGVSILYGGTMAAMGAVKSYADVRSAVKERDAILGEVVNRNLYNTLVAISTSDDVVLASSALADFDWEGNYDNAQDMKAEIERARAYVVADLNVKVMEGVVSETSRLESFRGTIEGVRNIVYQDKAGKYSNIIREAEMDGKKVYIINGYEANTNQYIVVDATTGEKTSVDKSKVKPTRELDVDTYIVESYKNEFSLETEKQRVADVKAKALQLDNPTEKDVARIASTLGITLPKVGNVVMLANGNMGAVTEVLSPTEYAMQDPSGATYKVHFTDILSTDKLTATAQGALARGEVARPVTPTPQAETTTETTTDENGITMGSEVTIDGRVGTVRARTENGDYVVAFEDESGNYEDTEIEFFTGEELASLMGIAPMPTAEAPKTPETTTEVASTTTEVATTEDGSVDIEQMSAEDAAKVLVQRAGAIEEAIAQVKQVIETVAEERKKTAKAEKKTSLNDIGKKSAELQALDTRLEFYGEVLAVLEGMLAEQQKQTMTEAQNVAEEAGVAPETTEATDTKAEQSKPVEQPTSGLIRNGAEMKFTDNVIRMVDFVAKRLGIIVEFVDGLKNDAGQPINGDITGKRVRISTSGTKGIKFIMGHEFFHRMKDLVDEHTYADFVNSIKEYAGEKVWNATMAHQRAVYRSHNARVAKEAMTKMTIDDVTKIAVRLNVNIEGLSLENAKDAVARGAAMSKEAGVAEVNAIFPKMLSYDDTLMVEECAADVAGTLVTNTNAFAKYVEDNSSNIALVRGIRKAIRAMREFFDSFGYTEQQRKLNTLEKNLASVLNEAAKKEAKAEKKPTTEGKTRNSLPSLVGVHNISLDKLRKVIKMGGLANPSVAVIDVDKQTHEGYGEYSLVLPKNMVDAQQGDNAGTWAGDALTATYPNIVRRIDDEALSRFYKDVEALPKAMQNSVRYEFEEFVNGRKLDGLGAWYLFEKNGDSAIKYVPSRYSNEVSNAVKEATNGSFSLAALTPEERAKCLDIYIAEEYNGDKEAFEAALEQQKKELEQDTVFKSEKIKEWRRKKLAELNEYGFDYDAVAGFLRDVGKDARESGAVDVRKTMESAKKEIEVNNLEADYEAWLDSLDERYGMKEYILDGYAENGAPKYLPHTLENVSKWMREQGRQGASGIFPTFLVAALPHMTNLESIRKHKAMLGKSKEERDAFENKWWNVYEELATKLHTEGDVGYWRLIEAVGKDNPKEFIKKEYGIELSEEDMAKFDDMVNAIRTEYPAGYFETKFERPLQLSDFTAAVVPNDIPLDVESRLKDAGVEVIEYEKGDNASRAEAMQKASAMENVRFSLQETNERFNAELATLTEESFAYKDTTSSAENQANEQKFSLITPEMDASYLDAVERGDIATAQQMVMEAAKLAMPNTKVVDENGNPKVVYHQTNHSVYINRETGQNWDELDWRERMEWDERDDWDDYWEERDFNTFSRVNARTTNELDGFFFAPEYDEYHEYGDRTIKAFLNIENPASNGDYNIDASKTNAGRDERIRMQNEGFDGVINKEDGAIYEYIAFNPNQIKSADPVTYDDNGNVIPLSERFNPEKEDIRYSISQEDIDVALENFTLTKDNVNDFCYALMQMVTGRAYFDYGIVGDMEIRIKDHTPDWDNFLDWDTDEAKYPKILNVTVGDYNNTDYRRNKRDYEEFVEKHPETTAVNVEIEDGAHLEDAVAKIHTALKENGIDFEAMPSYEWVEAYSEEKNDLSNFKYYRKLSLQSEEDILFEKKTAFLTGLVRDYNIPLPTFFAQTTGEFVRMVQDYLYLTDDEVEANREEIERMEGTYVPDDEIILINGGTIRGKEQMSGCVRHEFGHDITKKHLLGEIQQTVKVLGEDAIKRAHQEFLRGYDYKKIGPEGVVNEIVSYLAETPTIQEINAIFEGRLEVDDFISKLQGLIEKRDDLKEKEVYIAALPLAKKNIELQKQQYGAEKENIIVIPRADSSGRGNSISKGGSTPTYSKGVSGTQARSAAHVRRGEGTDAQEVTRYSLPDPDPSDVFYDEIPIFDEQGNEVDITTLPSEEAKEILDGKVRQMLEAEYDHAVVAIRKEAEEARQAVKEVYRAEKEKRRKGAKAARTNAARIDEIFGDTPFESLPYEVQALILIATGQAKIYWGDRGNKRGLASELGLTGSTGDRHAYRNIWGGAKKSFNEVVHDWWESLGGQERGIDDQDLRNALISALQSVQSSRDAMQEIINKYDDLATDRDNTLAEIDRNEEKELYEAKSAYEEHLANFELAEGEERTAYHDRAAQFFGNQSLSRVDDILEDLTNELERSKRKIERLKAEKKDVYTPLAESIQHAKDTVLRALERLRMFAGMEEVDLNDVARLINLVKASRSQRQIEELGAQATALVQRVSIKKAKTNLMRLLSLKLSNTDIIHKILKESDTWTNEEREAILKHLWKVSRNGLRVSKAIHPDAKAIIIELNGLVKRYKAGDDVERAKIIEEMRDWINPNADEVDMQRKYKDYAEKNKRAAYHLLNAYMNVLDAEVAYENATAKYRGRVKSKTENSAIAEAREDMRVKTGEYLNMLTLFNKELENLMVKGREDIRAFYLGREEHAKEIRNMGINAVGSDKARLLPDVNPTGMDKMMRALKRVNAAKNASVNAPYWTFDTVLNKIDRAGKNGKFYKYFMDKWSDSNADFLHRQRDHAMRLAEAMRKAFPKIARRKSAYDLFTAVLRKADETLLAPVKYLNRDREVETMRPTISSGMYILAMWRQPRYKASMEAHGITQSTIDDIYMQISEVDKGYIQFMDWVNDVFLPDTRLEYDVVHRALYGGSMAKEVNYFPANVLHYEEVKLDETTGLGNISLSPSALKERMSSMAMPNMNMNYFKVLQAHLQSMDQWASFEELRTDLSTLLSSKEFKNRLIAKQPGVKADGTGEGGLYENLFRTAKIATGLYETDYETLLSIISKAQQKWVAANIAYRFWTGLKQLSSIPIFAFYKVTDPKSYLFFGKALLRGLNPYGAVRRAMNLSPSMRMRWESRFAGLDVLMQETNKEKGIAQYRGVGKKTLDIVKDFVATINRYGMTANAAMDVMACAVGVNMIYDYEIYKATGGKREATEAEKRDAIRKAEFAFNSTQQSSEGAYMSAMQKQPALAMYTAYKNASMAAHRKRSAGLEELWKLAVSKEHRKFLREELGEDGVKMNVDTAVSDLMQGLISDVGFTFMGTLGGMLLFSLLFGWDEDDDEDREEYWEAFIKDASLSMANGYAFGGLFGEYWGSGKVTFNPALEELQKTLERISDDKGDTLQEVLQALFQFGIGVDLKTAYNIAAGLENMFEEEDGNYSGAVLKFLNAPQGYVKAFVGDRREDETLMEYQTRIVRLNTIFDDIKYSDYFDEKGNYIGEDAPSLVMSKKQIKDLREEYEGLYLNDMLKKFGGDKGYADYTMADLKHKQICGLLDWNPNATPSEEKVQTDMQDELEYYQKRVAKAVGKRKNWVGDDEGYYDLLMDEQEAKNDLINNYYEYIKQAGLGAY